MHTTSPLLTSSHTPMKHAHTQTSPGGVRQRPRLKVISGKVCTPGGEAKVEHSGMEIVDTFLIRTMDEGGEKREDLHVTGLRSGLSEFRCLLQSESQPFTHIWMFAAQFFSSVHSQQSTQTIVVVAIVSCHNA